MSRRSIPVTVMLAQLAIVSSVFTYKILTSSSNEEPKPAKPLIEQTSEIDESIKREFERFKYMSNNQADNLAPFETELTEWNNVRLSDIEVKSIDYQCDRNQVAPTKMFFNVYTFETPLNEKVNLLYFSENKFNGRYDIKFKAKKDGVDVTTKQVVDALYTDFTCTYDRNKTMEGIDGVLESFTINERK